MLARDRVCRYPLPCNRTGLFTTSGAFCTMETVFDWISIVLFSGIVVIFLQRSALPEPVDKLWHYLPPAIGCATVNFLGNHDQPALAITLAVATIAYVFYVLKPLAKQ